MYVQVIEGKAKDVAGMRAAMEKWDRELRPGAAGFLGTTAGVASDGRAIAFARFESAEAAATNSDRPEQGAWWAEMAACYDGDVTFTNSEDVTEFGGGGSNDAGFVQVMKASGVDRAAVERIDATFAEHADARPDLIGGFRVWTGPNTGYDVNYFTSEAEARAGESGGLPPELEAIMPEFQKLLDATEFFDLTDPWLH
jgi:hypothetical protein